MKKYNWIFAAWLGLAAPVLGVSPALAQKAPCKVIVNDSLGGSARCCDSQEVHDLNNEFWEKLTYKDCKTWSKPIPERKCDYPGKSKDSGLIWYCQGTPSTPPPPPSDPAPQKPPVDPKKEADVPPAKTHKQMQLDTLAGLLAGAKAKQTEAKTALQAAMDAKDLISRRTPPATDAETAKIIDAINTAQKAVSDINARVDKLEAWNREAPSYKNDTLLDSVTAQAKTTAAEIDQLAATTQAQSRIAQEVATPGSTGSGLGGVAGNSNAKTVEGGTTDNVLSQIAAKNGECGISEKLANTGYQQLKCQNTLNTVKIEETAGTALDAFSAAKVQGDSSLAGAQQTTKMSEQYDLVAAGYEKAKQEENNSFTMRALMAAHQYYLASSAGKNAAMVNRELGGGGAKNPPPASYTPEQIRTIEANGKKDPNNAEYVKYRESQDKAAAPNGVNLFEVRNTSNRSGQGLQYSEDGYVQGKQDNLMAQRMMNAGYQLQSQAGGLTNIIPTGCEAYLPPTQKTNNCLTIGIGPQAALCSQCWVKYSAREVEKTEKLRKINAKAADIRDAIVNEQNTVKSNVEQTALANLSNALLKKAAADSDAQQAKQNRDLANQMRDLENTPAAAPSPGDPLPNSTSTSTDTSVSVFGPTSTDTSTTTNPAIADNPNAKEPGGPGSDSLGSVSNGQANSLDSTIQGGPGGHLSLNGGGGGGGASGGGGGFSGGGHVGAGDKDSPDSGPINNIPRNLEKYGGGSGSAGGGVTVHNNGGSDSFGQALMAALGPKEPAYNPNGGIMKFDNGRAIANDSPSLLAPGANIFDNVHRAYQAQGLKGAMGKF